MALAGVSQFCIFEHWLQSVSSNNEARAAHSMKYIDGLDMCTVFGNSPCLYAIGIFLIKLNNYYGNGQTLITTFCMCVYIFNDVSQTAIVNTFLFHKYRESVAIEYNILWPLDKTSPWQIHVLVMNWGYMGWTWIENRIHHCHGPFCGGRIWWEWCELLYDCYDLLWNR